MYIMTCPAGLECSDTKCSEAPGSFGTVFPFLSEPGTRCLRRTLRTLRMNTLELETPQMVSEVQSFGFTEEPLVATLTVSGTQHARRALQSERSLDRRVGLR